MQLLNKVKGVLPKTGVVVVLISVLSFVACCAALYLIVVKGSTEDVTVALGILASVFALWMPSPRAATSNAPATPDVSVLEP